MCTARVGAARNTRFDAIIQSSNQLIDLLAQSKAQIRSIEASEGKADIVAPIVRTAALIERLKVAKNKETEVGVVLDLLVVEDSVDGRPCILQELIDACTIDVFAGRRELFGTRILGIWDCGTPLSTLGREKTGIGDRSEIGAVSANLEQKHVGLGRNLIHLDVTLILDAVNLLESGTRTRLELEVLDLSIRDPSVVLAELHGVTMIDPHTVVPVVVVVGATEDFIGHAALCPSQRDAVKSEQ